MALAYLGLAIFATYPAALHLTTQIAGDPGGDTLEFVWSTWWWSHALLDLHQNPIQISLLNFPAGSAFPLLPLMSQSFVLPLLLTRLVSPVFAYNIMFLGSYVLCGLAGYALCAEMSGDRLAGFVGGLIWAFFPSRGIHATAGHLFQLVIFSFPLMALYWWRLVKTPTRRTALLTGLVTALACTVHPIYEIYYIAPVIILLVGSALWTRRRAFWTKEYLGPLALAVGVTTLLVAPLLLPTLLQMQHTNLGYLTENGEVLFSMDALAFFLPPPNNPILLWFGHTPLASLARQAVTHDNETIGYLGWLPLLLAAVGARARLAQSRKWLLLAAVGGLLAMGPVLKVAGQPVQLTVDGKPYPVLLPYAFLERLPFVQWSRTPGRLEVLVILALSILVSFGLNRLRQARGFRRIPGLWLSAVTLVIMAEYLIRFPFPTTPAPHPAPLDILRAAPAGEGVLQLPVPDGDANRRALYWQTIHQHPLVWGRVYRDVPGTQTLYELLSEVLLADGGADIVPSPSLAERRAMLSEAQISWVIYDAQADPDGSARKQLEKLLGPPRAQDAQLALFAVTPASLPPGSLIYALGAHWTWDSPQDWGGQPGRWFDRRGLLYVYSNQVQPVRLAFTALPGPKPDPERITVTANWAPVGQFVVGDWAELATDSFSLQPGVNFLEFVDADPSYNYTGDPRCAGRSPIAGPYPVPVPCDPNDRTVRNLSLAISHVHLIAQDATPAFTPSGALFGETIRLLGYSLPQQVKPGTSFPVHLQWQAAGAITEDYTFFVHMYNVQGALVSQYDGWPLNRAYPSSHWQPGEVVAHNLVLSVPANLPPGPYSVQAGLYRWPSLEGLELTETTQAKDGMVVLGTVTVQP
jgi:hypothetical protein